jgi:hypothetical protein
MSGEESNLPDIPALYQKQQNALREFNNDRPKKMAGN